MKKYLVTLIMIFTFTNIYAQLEEYNEGIKNLNSKNYEDAVKWFSESIRLDPSYDNAYLKRGKANCLLGNFDKADLDIDETLKRSYENTEARYWKGMIYEGRGVYDLAIKEYNKADYDVNTKYHIGYCYYNLSLYKDAITYLTRAISEKNNLGIAYFYRALSYKELNDMDKACENFRDAQMYNYTDANQYISMHCEVSSTEISNAELLYNEGESLQKDYFYKAAIDKYKKAIEYNPDYDQAYYGIAMCYDKLLNYENDLRYDNDPTFQYDDNPIYYCNKAISIKRKLSYFNLRGMVYSKIFYTFADKYNLDDWEYDLFYKYQELAIKDFNVILRNDSNSYSAYSNIGWIYYDNTKYKEAIKYFLKALAAYKIVEKSEYETDIFMGLALSFFNQDRRKNQYFNEIKSHRPDILTGADGVKLLIKEGYYYSKKQKQDIVDMAFTLK